MISFIHNRKINIRHHMLLFPVSLFLRAFTELWKTNVSFVMSVHLSARNTVTRFALDGFS